MKKGFTLIELLVVISLIGILTTLVMANLSSARERGRDAQRKSDLRNIQTALRLYYNDHNAYPASTYFDDLWGLEWSEATTVYMPLLPKDPQSSQSYKYESDLEADTVTLSACLENKSDDKGVITTNTEWCPTGWMYQVKL